MKNSSQLMREGNYSHSKLLSEMEFGVWKYMFSNAAYALMGQRLLRIFPNKPTSSRQHRYDNTYVFQELDYINKLRNLLPIMSRYVLLALMQLLTPHTFSTNMPE